MSTAAHPLSSLICSLLAATFHRKHQHNLHTHTQKARTHNPIGHPFNGWLNAFDHNKSGIKSSGTRLPGSRPIRHFERPTFQRTNRYFPQQNPMQCKAGNRPCEEGMHPLPKLSSKLLKCLKFHHNTQKLQALAARPTGKQLEHLAHRKHCHRATNPSAVALHRTSAWFRGWAVQGLLSVEKLMLFGASGEHETRQQKLLYKTFAKKKTVSGTTFHHSTCSSGEMLLRWGCRLRTCAAYNNKKLCDKLLCNVKLGQLLKAQKPTPGFCSLI